MCWARSEALLSAVKGHRCRLVSRGSGDGRCFNVRMLVSGKVVVVFVKTVD